MQLGIVLGSTTSIDKLIKVKKGLVILAPFPAKETKMIDKLDVNGKIVLDSNGHRVQEEKEYEIEI